MIGTRGIPANYSGFETAVENISVRLAERGHDVTVYCRPHMVDYPGAQYKGVRLVKLPTIANKHLDTFVHTFISTLHMLIKRRCDVALFFIAGNSPFSLIPRFFRIPTAINVDGLDSKRDKWNKAAKLYLKATERMAPVFASALISDSKVVQRLYKDKFGAESVFIPYGASMQEVPGDEWLNRFGLRQREYVLFVGRLVPENCAHVLVEAFNELDTEKKLVIVGDAPYADDYITRLKKMAGPNVIFTGYVFGDGYRQLSQNAYIFAVPTVVGGTHPVITEAMAAGNCVLVSDHPPNLETIGDAGVSFSAVGGAKALRSKLYELLKDESLVSNFRHKAQERATSCYDWEVIVSQYEELCYKLTAKKPRADVQANL